MKTITIKNLVIQVDIPKAHGNMVADAQIILDLINTVLSDANLECSPQIMVSAIDADDIKIENNNSELQKEDVETVAKALRQTLTDAEIKEVLKKYPSAQDQDESATWDLVIEDVIYQIVNERKQ